MALPPARRRGPLAALAFIALVVVAIPVIAYTMFLVAALIIAPHWK